MEGRRSDRLLWVTSLLFVVWLVWVETSFQYFQGSLGSDLRLHSAGVALVAGSFLLPYGLVQVPVGRLIDRGKVELWLLLAALAAACCSLVFASSDSLQGLLLSRIGTGMACAVAFPASALLARRSLPADRFALAMGFTDGLLGIGAALAAVVPLLLGRSGWRELVLLQGLSLALMVALPMLLLGASRRSPAMAPAAEQEVRLQRWTRAGVNRLIQCCLLYAWGLGFVFGMAQYGLLSSLRGWSSSLMESLTLIMSIGLVVGMVSSGALGGRPQQRGRLLLIGTVITLLSLLLLIVPSLPRGVLLLPAFSFGVGIGTSVLAFPIAEAAAPSGQTALTVSIVNTSGTVMGGLMTIVSGLILQASPPGDLSLVLLIYGALALFGLAMASWISFSPEPAAADAIASRPGVVQSRDSAEPEG
ncbi:Major Facilitator Superfamily protein [Synechococcus sp. MIT S9509]|uniref:MFS transporter n=1 Tax=Synechococcus sp. MIT S9509 TaxID=1801630 RepID=UPI0007BB6388|nr:MFS transporter [Synechococcus sp. MIT S9509]KZR93703.1 Major Facilitator Superfamily protein [Synechococcus sp. MIT S9509]